MQKPQHILVIRFSAMGDVAMIIPVIKCVLQQNPQVQITVVSNQSLQPLFQHINRCAFFGADLKGRHQGVAGMYRLYKELAAVNDFNAIADLHNVLRSSMLKLFFSFSHAATATVNKGRKEKYRLTTKQNKLLRQLTPMHERYAAVFRTLGLHVTLNNKAPFAKQIIPATAATIFMPGKIIIGVAPFAQYAEKMYPIHKMKIVVQQLATKNTTILLFGNAHNEANILQQWASQIPGIINIAGQFNFSQQLALISNLKLMVSMDSANMHLASLFGVPVVSIWGATHPYAGFYGWAQKPQNIVQANLYCRPCSVFGNKPCHRGDHACMHLITEQTIISTIAAALNSK